MKIWKANWILFTLISILSSCSNIDTTNGSSNGEEVGTRPDTIELEESTGPTKAQLDGLWSFMSLSNLQNTSPKRYLEYISSINFVDGISLWPDSIPKNWVTDCDVISLMADVDNENRCVVIESSYPSLASEETKKRSTIGKEALRLINTYIEGSYPTELPENPKAILDHEKIKKIYSEDANHCDEIY